MSSIENSQEALEFLKNHQPMPHFDECDDDLWERYQYAVDILTDEGCTEAIPYILNSYGGGYIPDVFWGLNWEFPLDKTLPHFLNALNSPNMPTRELAMCFLDSMDYENELFGNKRFINTLVQKLDDSCSEVRYYAVKVLVYLETMGVYDSYKDQGFIQQCYLKETNKQVKKAYEGVATFEALIEIMPNREQARKPIESGYIPFDDWDGTGSFEEWMKKHPEYIEWLKKLHLFR